MKNKLDKQHWYDSVTKIFKKQEKSFSEELHEAVPPADALPSLEEWAPPDQRAA